MTLLAVGKESALTEAGNSDRTCVKRISRVGREFVRLRTSRFLVFLAYATHLAQNFGPSTESGEWLP